MRYGGGYSRRRCMVSLHTSYESAVLPLIIVAFLLDTVRNKLIIVACLHHTVSVFQPSEKHPIRCRQFRRQRKRDVQQKVP